jgi:hypothetical protein
MPIGPGKHDKYCTLIREETGASGVVVIVYTPNDASRSGFSIQADLFAQRTLPDILEYIAREIRATHAKGKL